MLMKTVVVIRMMNLTRIMRIMRMENDHMSDNDGDHEHEDEDYDDDNDDDDVDGVDDACDYDEDDHDGDHDGDHNCEDENDRV